MPRVVHFEIAVDDPERAIKFYEDVFGWKVQKWDGPVDYWLVSTGDEGQPGINGGILRRSGPQVIVNTLDVPDVDEYIAKLQAAGGTVALEKRAVPGTGYLAYGIDTEGNIFGIMQSDPSAR